MDHGLTCPSREKQLGQHWGNWGGGRALPQWLYILPEYIKPQLGQGPFALEPTGADPMIFTFLEAPEPGTLIYLDEQVYELAGIEPHTRLDGAPSALLRWDTACPSCGTGFSVTTGLSAKSLTRRCPYHRGGRPVKGSRGRKVAVRVVSP